MAVTINFTDRSGNSIELKRAEGETVRESLLKDYIPPDAVVVSRNGRPVHESHRLVADTEYTATLIDGYDIEDIRDMYAIGDEGQGIYEKRYLEVGTDGALNMRSDTLSYDDLESYVERTVRDTIEEYDLVSTGDQLLAPVTGGVDSAVQIILLGRLQDEFDYTVQGITFGEPGLDDTPAVQGAKSICSEFGIEHTVVPQSLISEVFGLTESLDDVLPELMSTDDADYAVLVESHVIRRTYEAFARREGFDALTYGLHTTDILSGLIQSYVTGSTLDSYVKKEFGENKYIYPITFLLKKEVHHYYRSITGEEPQYTPATVWKKNPQDRGFYAYIANVLQNYWPGIGQWLIEAHNQQVSERDLEYHKCNNCGGEILEQELKSISDTCIVCRILEEHEFLK